jgi:hypothetical protein
MTELSSSETADLLAGMADMKGGLALLAGETRLHSEILARIAQLLTPSEERSGPPIHELLTALIIRLDRQSVMLKQILDSQGNLSRNLPRDVVRVIDHTYGSGDQSPGGAAGEEATGAANAHDKAAQP